MISYEKKAKELYRDDEVKQKKAAAAGRAMDNSLKLEYSKGGHTNCRFMMSNYLKYFA